jgi:hypothetical protein
MRAKKKKVPVKLRNELSIMLGTELPIHTQTMSGPFILGNELPLHTRKRGIRLQSGTSFLYTLKQ